MDLKNQLVKHKMLGRGTIVAQDDKYITVAFASKTSNFVYTNPDTFGKFLTLVDEDLHNAVVHEVEETRLADQQRNAVKMAAAVPEIAESEPIQEKSERIPGKPMTFYVFKVKLSILSIAAALFGHRSIAKTEAKFFTGKTWRMLKQTTLCFTDATGAL